MARRGSSPITSDGRHPPFRPAAMNHMNLPLQAEKTARTAREAAHLEYRPDIDGTRAIAVMAVMAFHAFPNSFLGGFVGVDVFFVISGFLISTIIFKNLARGTFSYADFYTRRIKRIFPA